MSYRDYRHPDGPGVRLNGGDAILKNGEYLSLASSRTDYTKVGPTAIVKAGAGDYRLWAELVSPNKSYNNMAGAFDTDTITGYATSSDGLAWTFRDTAAAGVPDPIIHPNCPTSPAGGNTDWMKGEASAGTVLYDAAAAIWKAWGHGGSNSGPRAIWYATSSDGITNWTFGNTGQPIFQTGGSGWDGLWVADSRVIRLSAVSYIMLYRGQPASGVPQVGLATSSDGLVWTRWPGNPVLASGSAGAWDDQAIYGSALIQDAVTGTLRCWYGGDGTGDTGGQGLGYAHSEDLGRTWTKGTGNPIISLSATGLDSVNIGDTISGYDDGTRYVVHYGSEKAGPPYFRGRMAIEVRKDSIAVPGWASLADGASAFSGTIPNGLYGDREHALELTLQTGGTAPVAGGYCECWLVPCVNGLVPTAGGHYVRALPLPATANTVRTFEIELTNVCAWPPPFYAIEIVNHAGAALGASGHSLVITGRGL